MRSRGLCTAELVVISTTSEVVTILLFCNNVTAKVMIRTDFTEVPAEIQILPEFFTHQPQTKR